MMDEPASSSDLRPPVTAPVAISSDARDIAKDYNRPYTEEEIKMAFETFDIDKNKFVGCSEVRHVLSLIGERATDEEIDEMIRMCDTDGDGQVTFCEFRRMMMAPNLEIEPKPKTKLDKRILEMPSHMTQPQKTEAVPLQTPDPNSIESVMAEFTGGTKLKPSYIKQIYKSFQQIDVDNSGAIGYQEFLEVMEQKDCEMMQQMFKAFDLDGSGTVELKEFIVVLSKFTSANKIDKLKFCFMMFDEDGSGFLERVEVRRILQANFLGTTISEQDLDDKVTEIFTSFKLPHDGKLTYDMFMQLSKTHADLVYPITQASHTLGNISIDKLLTS